ncbi:uncharacterized protein LOC111082160 [Drosophila obscura]|uniref:uncharacterized protein LOC111082160 n=1 Tax=Drosophila obscura TaxID=7282 RepID=UPI001BB1C433|nr:uncharacterized protein LOC111082160 [Drosophila obscura]
MKATCCLCTILALSLLHLVMSSNSGSTTERAQTCLKNVQSRCTSTTKSCGRLGRANICQAFKNDCQRRLLNCNNKGVTDFHRKVSQSLCRGMPYDQKLPCGSGTNAIKVNASGTNNNNKTATVKATKSKLAEQKSLKNLANRDRCPLIRALYKSDNK